ncbi:MAG: hypothetical protein U0441_24745 [Polyangiaceae bacterium]
MGLVGAALFAAVSCTPPEDSTSSGTGGQGTSTSTSSSSTNTTSGTTTTLPSDPNCAVPPDADATVTEGVPAAGLTCIRYPFPLASPRDVLIANDGAIFVTEYGAGRIRELSADGFVPVAEGLVSPIGLREDDGGSLLVTEENLFSLARIDRKTGARTQIAKLSNHVTYMTRGPDGAAYISSFAGLSDNNLAAVYRVDLSNGTITPFATGMDVPEGVFFDPNGAFRAAEWFSPARILAFPPSGGDAANAAVLAEDLEHVYGLISDGKGGVLIADSTGQILRITQEGARTTLLTGIGVPGGMALSANGDLYIAEFRGFGQTGYLIRLQGL